MKAKMLLAVVAVFFANSAFAAQSTAPAKITTIRAYSGSTAYINVTAAGSLCGTTTFKIDLSNEGGKAEYAAALTAFSMDKNIVMEIETCSGYGTIALTLTVIAS